MDLYQILKEVIDLKGSDLHLKVGLQPTVRIHGQLRPLESFPKMTADQLQNLLEPHLSDHHKNQFFEKRELDMSLGLTGLGRFRVSLSLQRGTPRIVIRTIPHITPTIDDLNLPSVVKKIAQFERGLILVTGATGSGKSSTVAALIQHINTHKNKHILTIEDPIEFLIRDRSCLITQKEVGVDTLNFLSALRSALRQDPDVIFIGEMRDKETIETALMAAETGHLVLSTLHTVDSTETINRILMYFEPHQQQQIRNQLAAVLKGIISQRLARKISQDGFVPAVEVLINNKRIQEMIIKKERTSEIINAINDSYTTYGMQSFDLSLLTYLENQVIDLEEAMSLSTQPEDLKIRYSGIKKGHVQTTHFINQLEVISKPKLSYENEPEVELEEDHANQLKEMIRADAVFTKLKKIR